eukprot:TRINITY_DN17076_c0_g1_i3.p1 TRINITY_DN17076_c0_g1~~TRINITY_DN17076_c0_g1_i3.p1  ORF type:complete len:250 (-),score=44.51 TRINITY_DN17076_c0_g1_i3:106-855(-)
MLSDLEAQSKAHEGVARKLHGIGPARVRIDFVRKVYAVVAAQIIFTAAVVVLCVRGPLGAPILRLVSRHANAYRWGMVVSTTAVLFGLMANKKKFPCNLCLLTSFTVIMSLNVGGVCAIIAAAGLEALVVQSAVITALLFSAITVYTFKSKKDFSILGAILFPLALASVAFGLLGLFFPILHTGVLGLLSSFVGALIFCAYVAFDTFRIMHQLGPDDYVEGAIQLYLDIVNLFLYVLDLLVKMKKDESR